MLQQVVGQVRAAACQKNQASVTLSGVSSTTRRAPPSSGDRVSVEPHADSTVSAPRKKPTWSARLCSRGSMTWKPWRRASVSTSAALCTGRCELASRRTYRRFGELAGGSGNLAASQAKNRRE